VKLCKKKRLFAEKKCLFADFYLQQFKTFIIFATTKKIKQGIPRQANSKDSLINQ